MYLQILRGNVLTFINGVLFSFGVALVLLGRWSDALVSVVSGGQRSCQDELGELGGAIGEVLASIDVAEAEWVVARLVRCAA